MSHKSKIFLTGATGYVGGSVLERLINHHDSGNFEITILVRNPERAEKFKQFGINAVVGSFSDASLLENLAAAADVIIDTADSDDLEAIKIMLRGARKNFGETGKPPVFIHTSGTGLFIDDAAGLRSTEIIWDDANADQLEQLPPTAPHRNVDLEIIGADKEGYVRAYIIAPSMVYGLASGKLVDAGLMNKHSIQIPALISASLARGQAGMVGKGLNIWPGVHIDDVANLYIVLLNAIRTNPETVGHGREGMYFGENGEHTLYAVVKELGRVLVELGKSSSDEPTTFTQDEMQKYFKGLDYTGPNSRVRANRSRAIGWKATKNTADLLAGIKPEVEEILRTGHKVPTFL